MSADYKYINCPNEKDLELFSLTASNEIITNKIHNHLSSCRECQKKIIRLQTFYRILSKELDKPFSPASLDLCKELSPKTVKYGMLICTPHPGKNNHHGKAYLATLVFSANGDANKKKLSDYNLPADHIGVMLYTDPKQDKLLMIFCGKEEHKFAQWRVSIPGILEHVTLNAVGGTRINLLNFDLLNNHLFYFKSSNKIHSQLDIINKIQSVLSL